MGDGLFDVLSAWLESNFWLAGISAAGWGVFSILLSPCHLSSIPLLVGYFSNGTQRDFRFVFRVSVLFSLGMLLTIILIGGITIAFGRIAGDLGRIGNFILPALLLFVGLYLMDIIKLNWRGFGINPNKKRNPGTAFLLGGAIGFGLGPCTFAFMAPVLGAAFGTTNTNIGYASWLLGTYSLGYMIALVLAGILAGSVRKFLSWNSETGRLNLVKKLSGAVLVIAGIYFIIINI